LNQAIAIIGASIFFEMLMKHNFVHAGCHGGNIMVKIEKNIKWYRPIFDTFKDLQKWIIAHVIKISFDSPLLKKLAE
jgi:predicted unusual protein kinase regulating ubiquinone biosynthesis (AarF/ABC1/UbiB family)